PAGPQGPEGPQGPVGPAGPAGSRYLFQQRPPVVGTRVTIAPGAEGTATVTCPSDAPFATGGGLRVFFSKWAGLFVRSEAPISTIEWGVTVYNKLSSIPITIQADASCAVFLNLGP